MPHTRSRNTSGAPLAVGKDGVALRRSSRTSSLPTPSTSSSSLSRASQASSSATRQIKSLSKAFGSARAPCTPRAERGSSSPEELAPTVASRARSSLSRLRGEDAVPSAAFAVIGASTSSPFVKRVPLFVQRHVHPHSALLLGTSLPPSRLVLATTPSLSPPSSSAASTLEHTPPHDAPAPDPPLRSKPKRARSSSGSSAGTPSPCSDDGRVAAGRGRAVRRRLEVQGAQHDGLDRVEQAHSVEKNHARPAAIPPVDIAAVARIVRQSSIALCLIADDDE